VAPTRVRSSKLPDVILIRPAYIAKWFKWPSRILPHEHSQPSGEELRSSMFWRPKGRPLKKVANNWAITRSRTNSRCERRNDRRRRETSDRSPALADSGLRRSVTVRSCPVYRLRSSDARRPPARPKARAGCGAPLGCARQWIKEDERASLRRDADDVVIRFAGILEIAA
jgi:hypothetical protein